LYMDVIENAAHAAFDDYRFNSLEESELDKIHIEVSVLSMPKESKLDDILSGKHGVVLEFHGRSATFLPQVWDQLQKKEDFLSELCMKAGLQANAWKEKEMKFYVYTVQKFEE
jgi:AmmeMemoRadiSam system protein A